MKILLSLPESPFDPTNGAARSMRTIAELMAAAGHEVRCVATTATEQARTVACMPTLMEHRGVRYQFVEVDGVSTQKWRQPWAEQLFDTFFDRQIREFEPHILLCYGGHPTDVRRFHRAQNAGVKIVFGLRNFGYQRPGFLDFAAGALTSSRFLSDWYRTRFGIESTPLPLPMWPEDVVAENHETKYFTAINPTREKGSMILAAVFKELASKRPDIPLMIVASGSMPHTSLYSANLLPWQANPKEIYRQTKVLLVPSVWEEPAGRVIAEAMLNGIPPIITDRGGMPETANGGAFILPLAKHVTPARSTPVGLEVVQPWIDLITGLHDDPSRLAEASERASDAAMPYHRPALTPRYADYFERILAGEKVAGEHGPALDLAALSESQRHTPEGRTNA